ncbi:hypothetical protein [Burkholderia lata]|uniref:hypothetical protein n=1 Tax=Burkholderia lata (strain ATCC 17760 / DSM 23089 / LMG 22485 / NCIMB 9086 / R18194 / 383) TaxID=482957 RepID=UPI001581AE50|nr:hypothetical protein [Burkholderia lata]
MAASQWRIEMELSGCILSSLMVERRLTMSGLSRATGSTRAAYATGHIVPHSNGTVFGTGWVLADESATAAEPVTAEVSPNT